MFHAYNCILDRFLPDIMALQMLVVLYKRIVWDIQCRSLMSATPDATLQWWGRVRGLPSRPTPEWEAIIDKELEHLFRSPVKRSYLTGTERMLLSIYYLLLLPIGVVSPKATVEFDENQAAFREFISTDDYAKSALNLHYIGMDLASKMGGDLNRVCLPGDVFADYRIMKAVLFGSLSLGTSNIPDMPRWSEFIASLQSLGAKRLEGLTGKTAMKQNVKTANAQVKASISRPPRPEDERPDVSAILIAQSNRAENSPRTSQEPSLPSFVPPPWESIALAEADFRRDVDATFGINSAVDGVTHLRYFNPGVLTPVSLRKYCVTPLESFQTAPCGAASPFEEAPEIPGSPDSVHESAFGDDESSDVDSPSTSSGSGSSRSKKSVGKLRPKVGAKSEFANMPFKELVEKLGRARKVDIEAIAQMRFELIDGVLMLV